MKLLVTHSKESFTRLERGLESYGVDCVEFEGYGRSFEVGQPPEVYVDAGLVFPSRLVEGGYLDAEWGFPWVNDVEDVLSTRNKAACLARLEHHGVPVPDTHLLSSPVSADEVADAVEDVGLPAVVKPNSATQGRGVTKVDDVESAEGVADYFSVIHESSLVYDRSFLVQEFVEDAADYRVMAVDGCYAGAVERRGRNWKQNVHGGADAVAVEPPEEVVEIALEVAQALDISFCGVDVLDGARTVVNEVNSRPTVDERGKYEGDFFEMLAGVVKAEI